VDTPLQRRLEDPRNTSQVQHGHSLVQLTSSGRACVANPAPHHMSKGNEHPDYSPEGPIGVAGQEERKQEDVPEQDIDPLPPILPH